MAIIKWIQEVYLKIKDGLRLRRVICRCKYCGKIMVTTRKINIDICKKCFILRGCYLFETGQNLKSEIGEYGKDFNLLANSVLVNKEYIKYLPEKDGNGI
jgi:hypothetical protein